MIFPDGRVLADCGMACGTVSESANMYYFSLRSFIIPRSCSIDVFCSMYSLQ